jgi:DNA-binding CsgD family transcriptional regulator
MHGENAPGDGKQAHLTVREQQTLDLLLAGMPTKEIADRLGISPNTTAQHVKAILRRFGVRSRVALLGLLLGAERDDRSSDEPRALAPRERQALELLLLGLSAKEIALRLGIGVHTANDLTKTVFRRFGVGSRAALLATLLGQCRPVPPDLGT